MIRRNSCGFTIVETIFLLGVILALALTALPEIQHIKRHTYVVRCQAQLSEIAVAIEHYRSDHNGKTPLQIRQLVPQYLTHDALICPYISAMAPDVMAIAASRSDSWSSYFMYNQKVLDELRDLGKIAFGYSEVLAQRKGDTPLVVCREHRAFTLIGSGTGKYARWHFPQDPVLILRFDGRVTKTFKGGSLTNGTSVGTEQDLVQL